MRTTKEEIENLLEEMEETAEQLIDKIDDTKADEAITPPQDKLRELANNKLPATIDANGGVGYGINTDIHGTPISMTAMVMSSRIELRAYVLDAEKLHNRTELTKKSYPINANKLDNEQARYRIVADFFGTVAEEIAYRQLGGLYTRPDEQAATSSE